MYACAFIYVSMSIYLFTYLFIYRIRELQWSIHIPCRHWQCIGSDNEENMHMRGCSCTQTALPNKTYQLPDKWFYNKSITCHRSRYLCTHSHNQWSISPKGLINTFAILYLNSPESIWYLASHNRFRINLTPHAYGFNLMPLCQFHVETYPWA